MQSAQGRDEVTERLQRQVAELEALQAMFYEEGAMFMAPLELEALALAQHVCAGDLPAADCLPDLPPLSGYIRPPGLQLQGQPIGLHFTLPRAYPHMPASLQPECALPRQLHQQLQDAVQTCAEQGAEAGSECLIAAVEVLKNAVEVLECATPPSGGVTDTALHVPPAAAPAGAQAASEDPAGGARGAAAHAPAQAMLLTVLIWFHHIKSTQKRKHIVQWARELGLAGACKPGFPGVCVAQGMEEDVREWVGRVRALSWQAMQVRAEHSEPLSQPWPTCTGAAAAAAAPPSSQWAQQLREERPQGGLARPFVELLETGMSELAAMCCAAGLEQLFLAALKIS